MNRRYRLIVTAKAGAGLYARGSIVTEEIANRGYPSLLSLGAVIPLTEPEPVEKPRSESDGDQGEDGSRKS
jgi:hypothetical protein